MAAYDTAMSILPERCGDEFSVAQSYKRKISKWPKVKYRYGKALRELSDFLNQCLTAMTHPKCLKSLDTPEDIARIFDKLPRAIVDRWTRVACQWLYGDAGHERRHPDHVDYTPFSEVCNFIEKEARVACCPIGVLGDDSVKKENPSQVRKVVSSNANSKHVSKSFVSGSIKEVSTATQEDGSKPRLPCVLRGGQHWIDTCSQYLAIGTAYKERLVAAKGLCFLCLKKGPYAC